MSDPPFNLQQFNSQQESLRQHGRLHWAHWLILAMSIVITYLAWNFSRSMLHERSVSRFEREAHRVVDQIGTRLSHYEDALMAGSATMQTYQGDMTREQWRQYATTLDLPNRYPGVNGIGVIREVAQSALGDFISKQESGFKNFRVFPDHEYPLHLPIVYIEPEVKNWEAIGLDVAFEENRRQAALLAKTTNSAQISGPITLVQDNGQTPGFLFYTPFNRGTKSSFDGLIYSPLVVEDLIKGVLSEETRHVYFSIHDGDDLIYNEFPEDNTQLDVVLHEISIEESFYGRSWIFTINSSPAFSGYTNSLQPLIVLLSGLTIDLMLFGLFVMLTRSNRRLLFLAEKMIGKLGHQAADLSEKNDSLESFAHTVSHDLKTPINSIRCISEFMKEDMNELPICEETKEAMTTHINLIENEAKRSISLIGGILSYSSIGYQLENTQAVDVTSLVRDVGNSLGLLTDQLVIKSDIPVVLITYKVQLTQIFENLIGNAYKYHPSQSDANITVSSEELGDYYRFYVSDNGNGVDPKYHERIFKPFITLEAVKSSNSNGGIGLSIIKKLVTKMGGDVGILSDSQQGATFYFDWPTSHLEHDDKEQLNEAA